MVTVKEPPTAPDSRPRHSTSVSGLSSRQWPDSGPTVARQRPTGPDTPTVRAQGHRSCGQTRPTPPTPPTRSTLRHSTLRHAQTRRTRLTCPTTLRHRSDTGQTPPTPSTPVSIDTAPTLLRHYSDTSDTSDTQTHQGSNSYRSVCPDFRAGLDESFRTRCCTSVGHVFFACK